MWIWSVNVQFEPLTDPHIEVIEVPYCLLEHYLKLPVVLWVTVQNYTVDASIGWQTLVKGGKTVVKINNIYVTSTEDFEHFLGKLGNLNFP